MTIRSLAVLALCVGAGCTDLSQRWELDHARVLAVRLSTPGLAAGGSATVDALVVDDSGAPQVVTPTAVAAVEDATRTGGLIIDGATVTAGDEAAIGAARAAAGVAADQPLVVTLGAVFVIDGEQLIATKRVRIGTEAVNPAPVTMVIDGVDVDGVATVAATGEVALALRGFDPAAELEFDWLTSTGALSRSETSAAILELAADDPRTGHVVALVRSDTGGVTWTTAAITAP